MINFIIKRLLGGILVVLGVTVIISSIIYLAPVDPTRLSFGQRSEDATVLQKRAELGLDQPFHIQLYYYLGDISPIVINTTDRKLHSIWKEWSIGELRIVLKKPYLRESFQTGRSVSLILADAIPQTIILAASSLLFASILGMIFGFIAASNKSAFLDECIVAVSTLGYSVPSYVSAIVLAIIFGFVFHRYTGLNMQGSLFDINDLGDDVIVMKNLILPMIALGVRPVSVITQLTRSAVIDVLHKDYIKTARSKGLDYLSILKKHVLKNSMNPIVTTISGWFASLLAGAFFVEYVFNFKGLGFATVTALLNYDIPVLLACIIFVSICFVILNILVDVIYKYLNPRVN